MPMVEDMVEDAEIKCSICGMMVQRTSELYYKCPRCGNTGLMESTDNTDDNTDNTDYNDE